MKLHTQVQRVRSTSTLFRRRFEAFPEFLGRSAYLPKYCHLIEDVGGQNLHSPPKESKFQGNKATKLLCLKSSLVL
jgi:hypothetical protein